MGFTVFGFFGIVLPQKEPVGDIIRVGRWICRVWIRIGNWHLLKRIKI